MAGVLKCSHSLKYKLKVQHRKDRFMEIKIIRKIDDLGRIVIPKDVRASLELHPGDAIAIGVADGAVTLVKIGGDGE